MSLIAKKKAGTQVPPMEAGTYIAVCVGVVDIGEQKSDLYNNYASQVIFIFEIPSARILVDGEDKPRWLSEFYRVSLNEKANLAKMLTSWRGKAFTEEEADGFDLSTMLGRACQLQVLEVARKDGTPCNRIAGVFGLPKGFPEPTPENPLLLYSIEDGENEVYSQLPEWIRDKISKSVEWQREHNGTDKIGFDEPVDEPPAALPTASEVTAVDSVEIPF